MAKVAKYISLIKESLPGLILITIGVSIVVLGRAALSPLPMATSFATFFVASISSRTIMRKKLSYIYNHKYYDHLSIAMFSIPITLFLHLGYEYARMTIHQSLEMTSSLIVGLGVFIVVYPLLRLM